MGYRALWKRIYDISVIDLKENYDKLGIHFDLWLGESNTQDRIPGLIEQVERQGWAVASEGAVIIDVADPKDKKEMPPLMLVKSDGSVLYATTDLATIDQRIKDYQPNVVLYVADDRQSDHFTQVFRAAYKTGIAPAHMKLEYIGFGTMNGKDGKPFKTRAGDTIKLKDFIQLVIDKALAVMEEADIAKSYEANERMQIAHMVGIATLKFADLSNHRTKNYIFDLDRFVSFEGRTGPYLLYTAVRIKSILRNASERGFVPGAIRLPETDIERNILLKILELPDVLYHAFENRAPNYICDYIYTVASLFNNFYHEHHILREKDQTLQASRLGLSVLLLKILELTLDLIGIEVPERM
jgi:arginyl-tRNA synthetase